jgi:hypothetical protein
MLSPTARAPVGSEGMLMVVPSTTKLVEPAPSIVACRYVHDCS